jgi:hypothetical protein
MNMNDAVQNETGFLSLADLANMNTDGVAAVTSLVPKAGVYTMKGEEVKGGQRPEQEGKAPLYYFNFVGEILEAKLIDKSVDPESVVGRKLTDSYTLWPAQFSDMIALLKGRYQLIGLPNTGPRLGGIEGQEPGWLDGYAGHVYKVKVSHFNDKQGQQRARFTYLKADASDADAASAA